MVRRNQSGPTPTRIDRDFPHQVALLDDVCVDRNFQRIHEFCKGLGVEWHTRHVIAIWPNGKHENHRLHCFADAAPAEAFQAHFGGVMFDPKRDRQGGLAKGAWKRSEPWRRIVRAEGPYSRLP
ncbi:hypothetical protein [Mesorhizobium sp. IMUNJ 23232]|uniref:hypothetical protein n=1 Tax=Mesorhizobium sp. IMUNJ 23232 TaxID=3376064 RepID=UPI0037896426